MVKVELSLAEIGLLQFAVIHRPELWKRDRQLKRAYMPKNKKIADLLWKLHLAEEKGRCIK